MHLCQPVQLSLEQVWHELLHTAFPLPGPVETYTATLPQQQCTAGGAIPFCNLNGCCLV
jgi:hypothetical protein